MIDFTVLPNSDPKVVLYCLDFVRVMVESNEGDSDIVEALENLRVVVHPPKATAGALYDTVAKITSGVSMGYTEWLFINHDGELESSEGSPDFFSYED